MNDEEKLLWMRDALNKVVRQVNKKEPNPHLFAEVKIAYDGEVWEGSVHPIVYMLDTGMPHSDRVFMIRRFRTDTFEELINQMMHVVEFQDNVFETKIKNGGDGYDN